jgi:hypothetical protein
MKKLFAILLVTILTSCGAALEPPKSNTDYKNIIGKPIKIGNIEVAQYDFPKKMNWEDAKIFCTNLGKGWRLPTIEELSFLYQNKDEIGSFSKSNYWSNSTNNASGAWSQNFSNGFQNLIYNIYNYQVRAVRLIK